MRMAAELIVLDQIHIQIVKIFLDPQCIFLEINVLRNIKWLLSIPYNTLCIS